jgi:hypothetical protein
MRPNTGDGLAIGRPTDFHDRLQAAVSNEFLYGMRGWAADGPDEARRAGTMEHLTN